MALRATLWLSSRMTEQADIPATENKSAPPSHPHALRAPHALWLVSQSPRVTAAWSGLGVDPPLSCQRKDAGIMLEQELRGHPTAVFLTPVLSLLLFSH